MLLHEFDPNKDAVINPEMLVNKIEDFPDVTVSCFSKKLFNNVLSFLIQNRLQRSTRQLG